MQHPTKSGTQWNIYFVINLRKRSDFQIESDQIFKDLYSVSVRRSAVDAQLLNLTYCEFVLNLYVCFQHRFLNSGHNKEHF